MIKKIWKGIKKIFLYNYDNCFLNHIEDFNLDKNKKECPGSFGGDRSTGFLSYECLDCPYFKV